MESYSNKFLPRASAVLGIVAAAALMVLMMATVVDVTVRWVSRSSVPGMIEIAESALVISAFLGLAWTSVQGGHVAVSLVTDRLRPRAAHAVSIILWTLNTALLSWMSYATFTRAQLSTSLSETRFGLVQWPVWPLRWVIFIGLIMWAMICLNNLLRVLSGQAAFGEELKANIDA